MTTATMTAKQNRAAQIEEAIRQHGDVVRGHDAVHPDRSDCRGVSGCALMRAEVDAEAAVSDLLKDCARRGVRLGVTAL